MQLDIDIEPTLRFPGMTSIDKQLDQSESEVRTSGVTHLHFFYRQKDTQTEGDA